MDKNDNEEFYNSKEIDNCLLVGNGFNRTLSNQISWGDLLKQMAKGFGVSYYKDKPMPLEFERIFNEYLATLPNPSTQEYLKAKRQIAKIVGSGILPKNAIHREITQIKLDAVITTNYDTLIEQAFGIFGANTIPNGTKYIMDPTYQMDEISFYHPHGIHYSPSTICLGYEHYAGMIEHLRYEINRKEKKQGYRMIIEQVLSGSLPKKNTWGERFYTSNMSIIGLGLHDCEIDLWWLLAHRAYLYYSDYSNLKMKIVNGIDYYDIVEGDKYLQKSAEERKRLAYTQNYKYRLLEDFHVNVKLYYLADYKSSEGSKYSSPYELAYEQMLHDIAKKYN